jgi:hypothetical protein
MTFYTKSRVFTQNDVFTQSRAVIISPVVYYIIKLTVIRDLMDTKTTKTKVSHTDGLLRDIAIATTDSNVLDRIVSRLISVRPSQRSDEDECILRLAILNSSTKEDTFKEAIRMMKERGGVEEIYSLMYALIKDRRSEILRTD